MDLPWKVMEGSLTQKNIKLLGGSSEELIDDEDNPLIYFCHEDIGHLEGQATTRLFRGLYDLHWLWLLITYLSVLGSDPPSMTKLDPGPSCWLEAFAGGWGCDLGGGFKYVFLFSPLPGEKNIQYD